jgi:hypothetical protein
MLKRIVHDGLVVLLVLASAAALVVLWAGYMARIEEGLDMQQFHQMEVP